MPRSALGTGVTGGNLESGVQSLQSSYLFITLARQRGQGHGGTCVFIIEVQEGLPGGLRLDCNGARYYVRSQSR